VVDELAPAGGEEVAARRAAVNVAEAPLDAVDVGDGEELDGRIGTEVERRKTRVRTVARHGEAAAVVGVGGSQDLRERNDAVLAVLLFFVSSLRGVVWKRLLREGREEELSEDLVGERIGEEIEGGHVAGDEGKRAEERVEVMRGRGVLQVALGEVVNPRMELGDLHGGAGACPPDFGVDAAGLRRRHDGELD